MNRKRLVTNLVAAVYFGALAGIAFMPFSAAEDGPRWGWSLAIFVPVGALLLLLMGRRRWWAAFGFGVLGTAWIEAAQSVWVPQRADIVDLLAGCLGVAVGVLLAFVLIGARKSVHSHDAYRVMSQSGNGHVPLD
jgi:apolipoprotein N-acyltransferase